MSKIVGTGRQLQLPTASNKYCEISGMLSYGFSNKSILGCKLLVVNDVHASAYEGSNDVLISPN